jgi:hypothetical protein
VAYAGVAEEQAKDAFVAALEQQPTLRTMTLGKATNDHTAEFE